jgi:two-component sensor histidine kinase
VQLFALALHELLTNALKHGALLKPRGRIAISWAIAEVRGDSRVLLTWRETGIGPLTESAMRPRGFGLELLEILLPFELDAVTGIDFDADMLRVQLSLALREGCARPAPPRSTAGSP